MPESQGHVNVVHGQDTSVQEAMLLQLQCGPSASDKPAADCTALLTK